MFLSKYIFRLAYFHFYQSQSILIDFQIPCYHFNYRLLVSHTHKHHRQSCGYIACTPCKLTPVNASETNYVLSGILVYDKHSFNCFNIARILSVQYIWNYFVGNVLWCIFMYVIFIFSFRLWHCSILFLLNKETVNILNNFNTFWNNTGFGGPKRNQHSMGRAFVAYNAFWQHAYYWCINVNLL